MKAPQKAQECPACLWFDGLAQQAVQDPEGLNYSGLTDAKILRRRHAESGECLNPEGAA